MGKLLEIYSHFILDGTFPVIQSGMKITIQHRITLLPVQLCVMKLCFRGSELWKLLVLVGDTIQKYFDSNNFTPASIDALS